MSLFKASYHKPPKMKPTGKLQRPVVVNPVIPVIPPAPIIKPPPQEKKQDNLRALLDVIERMNENTFQRRINVEKLRQSTQQVTNIRISPDEFMGICRDYSDNFRAAIVASKYVAKDLIKRSNMNIPNVEKNLNVVIDEIMNLPFESQLGLEIKSNRFEFEEHELVRNVRDIVDMGWLEEFNLEDILNAMDDVPDIPEDVKHMVDKEVEEMVRKYASSTTGMRFQCTGEGKRSKSKGRREKKKKKNTQGAGAPAGPAGETKSLQTRVIGTKSSYNIYGLILKIAWFISLICIIRNTSQSGPQYYRERVTSNCNAVQTTFHQLLYDKYTTALSHSLSVLSLSETELNTINETCVNGIPHNNNRNLIACDNKILTFAPQQPQQLIEAMNNVQKLIQNIISSPSAPSLTEDMTTKCRQLSAHFLIVEEALRDSEYEYMSALLIISLIASTRYIPTVNKLIKQTGLWILGGAFVGYQMIRFPMVNTYLYALIHRRLEVWHPPKNIPTFVMTGLPSFIPQLIVGMAGLSCMEEDFGTLMERYQRRNKDCVTYKYPSGANDNGGLLQIVPDGDGYYKVLNIKNQPQQPTQQGEIETQPQQPTQQGEIETQPQQPTQQGETKNQPQLQRVSEQFYGYTHTGQVSRYGADAELRRFRARLIPMPVGAIYIKWNKQNEIYEEYTVIDRFHDGGNYAENRIKNMSEEEKQEHKVGYLEYISKKQTNLKNKVLLLSPRRNLLYDNCDRSQNYKYVFYAGYLLYHGYVMGPAMQDIEQIASDMGLEDIAEMCRNIYSGQLTWTPQIALAIAAGCLKLYLWNTSMECANPGNTDAWVLLNKEHEILWNITTGEILDETGYTIDPPEVEIEQNDDDDNNEEKYFSRLKGYLPRLEKYLESETKASEDQINKAAEQWLDIIKVITKDLIADLLNAVTESVQYFSELARYKIIRSILDKGKSKNQLQIKKLQDMLGQPSQSQPPYYTVENNILYIDRSQYNIIDELPTGEKYLHMSCYI